MRYDAARTLVILSALKASAVLHGDTVALAEHGVTLDVNLNVGLQAKPVV